MTDNINLRVAEKVMDLRVGHLCAKASGPPETGFRDCPCSDRRLPYWGMACEFDRGRVGIPYYTATPILVFGPGGVVDTMLCRGFNFTLRRDVDGQNQATFQGAKAVAFSVQSSKQLVAVCKAALEAMEGSNEGPK